jgi:hypothetical protein
MVVPKQGMARTLLASGRPIVDERGSPGGHVVLPSTPLLQPTDERRRTGSHYTPRALTEPIVRTTLERMADVRNIGIRAEEIVFAIVALGESLSRLAEAVRLPGLQPEDLLDWLSHGPDGWLPRGQADSTEPTMSIVRGPR